ncbi:alpha-L-rhamnosidase C-terminal domain-containing protein [Streptomyces avermitilis]|uniref:alpha-L-rhamnosidase C-terminal domain-containing protein n=1 Tax=Streptomyces avermitilis TaxID=33903 RepID=UPI0033AF988F
MRDSWRLAVLRNSYPTASSRCIFKTSQHWARSGDSLRLAVEVPVGAEAEVHVPAARRRDTTAPHWAEYVRSEPGHVVYRVPHGRGEFAAKAESG